MTYDPAFMNTANCRSAITYIDGDKGILLYRGYPIEQLAEDSDYLETAYLILFGELPTASQQVQFMDAADHHAHHASREHEEVHGGLPGTTRTRWASSSAPWARCRRSTPTRSASTTRSRAGCQMHRLIAKVPTHRRLRLPPHHRPSVHLSRQRSQLHRQLPEHAVQDDRADKYQPNPVLARALDVLFILHADHEQNCSTSAMRNIGSSQSDPYSALAGAAAALYGPLHGGANEAVLRMLERDRLRRARCRSSSRR